MTGRVYSNKSRRVNVNNINNSGVTLHERKLSDKSKVKQFAERTHCL